MKKRKRGGDDIHISRVDLGGGGDDIHISRLDLGGR